MKQRLRKITQLIPVFLLVLFISCEKDLYDIDQPQNKYSIKEYSFETVSKMAKYDNASSKISEGLGLVNQLSKSSRGEIEDLIIDSTTIKEITLGDYTTYTMLIKSDKPTGDYFENLIIEVNGIDGIKAYLIKYTPSQEMEYIEEHDAYTFIGTTEKYQYPTCLACPEDTEDTDSTGEDTTSGGTSWYTCITVMMCNEAFSWQPVGVEHIATPECSNTYPRTVCGTNISTGGGNTTGSGYGGVGPSGGQSGTGGSTNTTNTTTSNPVTVIIPPPVPSPCEKLSELLAPTKANILPNINWLKQKVNDPLNTVEHGVELEKNVDNLQYTNTNVSSLDHNSVPLAIKGDVYGGAHCHTWDGHQMFSFGDLELLIQFYDGATTPNIPEVTIILVCRTNLIPLEVSTYALKIDNIERLRGGIKAMYRNPKYAGYLTAKAKNDKIMEDEGLFYDKCNDEYEKSFLQRFANFGISLYKASDNLDSWNKLQIAVPDPLLPNTTTVTQIPCTTN